MRRKRLSRKGDAEATTHKKKEIDVRGEVAEAATCESYNVDETANGEAQWE